MGLILGKAAKEDAFQQAVAKAASQDTTRALRAAKAAYLVDIFPGKSGAQGINSPSATWRRLQAVQWCEKNLNGQDSEIVKIPNNLPTLGDAVRQLDPPAIDLSWQVLSRLDSNGLKGGCNAAIKRFIDNAKN